LEDLANVTNAPFICLTETHLNPHVLDAEIQIKNYTLFRSDRVGRSHGGVCIYVRNNMATSVILKDSNAFCDTLVLRIHKLDLLLINIYRPPKCPSNLFLQSLEAIKQIINNFEEHDKRAHDILLTSDCNFPDIKWVNGCGHLQEGRDHGHLGEDRRQALALLEFAEEYFI
jgi:exonuclease III